MRRHAETGDGLAAVELIREVGFFRLGGTSGCLCCGCEVLNYEIYFSCRKSEATLYVRCPSLGTPMEWLRDVAVEVMRQIREQDDHSNIRVRYCTYTDDHHGFKCVYCAKPRHDKDGYLCVSCLSRKKPGGYENVADTHDFRRIDFVWPPGASEPVFAQEHDPSKEQS